MKAFQESRQKSATVAGLNISALTPTRKTRRVWNGLPVYRKENMTTKRPTTGPELVQWLKTYGLSQRALSRLLSAAAGTHVSPATINSQIIRGRLTPLMRAAISGLVASGKIPGASGTARFSIQVARLLQEQLLRIEEQREEILEAFIAKYGFHPDEAIQVTQGNKWWVERKEK